MTDIWDNELELDPWDYMVTLSTGEIVQLPEPVARARIAAKEWQETERIRYCAKYHKDPATFTGCPGCGNTGKNYATNLPCYCMHSKRLIEWIQRQEDDETERLAELVRSERKG